ncbi:MAG: helix-turn-helix domain-containing protein [Pseudomonadota bacterium]
MDAVDLSRFDVLPLDEREVTPSSAPDPVGDEPAPLVYGETTTSIVASSALTFALSCGLPVENIAFLTGVNPADIAASKGMIRDDLPPRIMRATLDSGVSSAPSLEMARLTPSPFTGGLECAAFYAPTPLELLKVFIDYIDIIGTRINVRSEASRDHVAYHFSHPLDALDNGTIHEVGVTKLWWFIRGLIGPSAKIAEVSLGFTSNATQAAYDEAFGVPVSFGRFPGEHTLVFRKDLLNEPCALADESLFNLGRLHLNQQRRLRETRSVSRQMESLQVATAACVARGVTDVQTVADNANMSVRSAQRLASQHGITFSKLIERAKFERAQSIILSDHSISNAVLAEELGYGDERSLSRAFKRGMGLTPSQFKRMLRG